MRSYKCNRHDDKTLRPWICQLQPEKLSEHIAHCEIE